MSSCGWPREVLAALLLGGILPVAPAHAQFACPDPPAPIGRITIERVEVFDPGGTRFVKLVNRGANMLHARTRERVVLRELLFREGEPCRSEALAQTERNLRALGIFQQVDVVPVPAADGRVDVLVRVRDAWSLRVSGRYQRTGGVPVWDLGLADANIGGQGFAAGVRRRNGFEADITTAWLENPRLGGSRERLSLRFDDRSDGHATALALSRPFYALDTRWAHDIGFVETHDVFRIYQDGDISESFGRRAVDAVAGLSVRLAAPAPSEVWRLGFGYRFVTNEYPDVGSRAPVGMDIPLSRRWAGPYVSLQFLRHRFVKRRGMLFPHRDVDVNLGAQADLGMFVSQRVAAWRTTSRVILGAGVSRGWLLPGNGVLVSKASATVHAGGGESVRADVAGSVRGWWQRSATHVLTTVGEIHTSVNPEPGYRVYLGGSPGLRGFRERAFQGTRSTLLVVEDRKYADWKPIGLMQFGVAAFVEAGAVGGGAVTSGRGRILAAAGIGLRIAKLRSSASGVIRIDVAYPLTRAPDGRRRPQLVIGYSNEF